MIIKKKWILNLYKRLIFNIKFIKKIKYQFIKKSNLKSISEYLWPSSHSYGTSILFFYR